MKRLILLSVFIFGLFIVSGCEQVFVKEVVCGSKTVCNECSSVIDDETKVIKVAISEADKYNIETKYDICNQCQIAKLKDPNIVAQNFFNALKKRNIEEAMKYCDTSINFNSSIPYTRYTSVGHLGSDHLLGGPGSPRRFCETFASTLNDEWIVSKNVAYKDGRPYFVIANTKHIDIPFVNNKKVIAHGYGLFMNKVGDIWLINEITGDYLIFEN